MDPESPSGKTFEFTGRGAKYLWGQDELDDTIFEGERWDKPSMRKRVGKLRVGQKITVGGETLRRVNNPHDESCPHCGLHYDTFRTGLSYGEVYMMLWTADPDPATWQYERRGTVLGYWRMLKHAMWDEHLAQCDWYAQQEDEPAAAVGNPLVPGPPPQYVMGGMGTPEIWRYRGRDIEVSHQPWADPKYQYRATWGMLGCEQSRTGRTNHDALVDARYDIDLESLGPLWVEAESVVDFALSHYSKARIGPINRGKIARYMETFGKQHPTLSFGRSKQDSFDKLSLPDRLRLIDEVIAHHARRGWVDQKLVHNPLLPGPPPQYVMGGMGTPEIWHYRGIEIVVKPEPNSLLGPYRACWGPPGAGRSVSGTDPQSALGNARFRIDVNELGPEWTRAAALAMAASWSLLDYTDLRFNRSTLARQIAAETRPGRSLSQHHGLDSFNALPLPDRLRILDEVVDFNRRMGRGSPGRFGNPLLSGPMPQYVMGGMGVPEVWSYRGRNIVVEEQPHTAPPLRRWLATWGGGRSRAASDKHNVLAVARTVIDLEDLSQDWNDAWRLTELALGDYLGETAGGTPVNRGRLARKIELMNRAKGLSPSLRGKLDAFYALPLSDRLRLLDEVIDFYVRLDAIHSSRLRPNPDPLGAKLELLAW